jgi:hypothetical protein
MGMDWIAIDFNWGHLWQDPGIPPDLSSLNQAMLLAKNGNLNVMLSITNPPQWAVISTGPDPDLTAGVTLSLAHMFPETLLAVELFPGANTKLGWGAPPNPVAYVEMLAKTDQVIKHNNVDITIVAAGLVPLPTTPPMGDMDDLKFFEDLYRNGAAQFMPIVSLRLDELTGEPMQVPLNGEHRYLRHFEEVRKVMVQNNHQQGLIWITSFCWPSDGKQETDQHYQSEESQASWLREAYRLMRAHLYIGAAFFAHLNPPEGAVPSVNNSLVTQNANLHPAASDMSRMAEMSGKVKTVLFKGNISKKTPLKLALKPVAP